MLRITLKNLKMSLLMNFNKKCLKTPNKKLYQHKLCTVKVIARFEKVFPSYKRYIEKEHT